MTSDKCVPRWQTEAAPSRSRNAVDAFVVATAASLAYAVILTGDPDDLASLAAHTPGVAVQALP